MKKNIGLLVPSMNSGGAERVISRLSHILNDKYNVFVILFEDTYMKYECKGTIINMGVKSQKKKLNRLFLPFIRAKKLKKLKKDKNLDVVISFMDSPNIVNLLSQTISCKTVVSIRNYSFKKQGKMLKKLKKMLYSRADKIIGVSKLISEQMKEELRLERNKVTTIYNPYNIGEIQRFAAEDLQEEHQKFFQEGEVFVSVGRNVYQKGFWHLIKAFKIVTKSHPNAKLVIIGRDEKDGKALRLVEQLDLSDNVLLTGYQENPFKYISRSTVYVLSSLFEGFPNSMVEAMACGCPVIATDCKSGPREILYSNANFQEVYSSIHKANYGILVPPLEEKEDWDPHTITNSERILAEGMLMYLEDIKIKEHYTIQAQKRVKDFSYERCRKKFEDIIDK